MGNGHQLGHDQQTVDTRGRCGDSSKLQTQTENERLNSDQLICSVRNQSLCLGVRMGDKNTCSMYSSRDKKHFSFSAQLHHLLSCQSLMVVTQSASSQGVVCVHFTIVPLAQ